MTYSFGDQLAAGESSERILDHFFAQWYDITYASRGEQADGIDRHWVSKIGSEHMTVEYKSDWTASRTDNIFVETISVDTIKKAGWAYTSTADLLVYYLPDDDLAYAIPFSELRRHLARWQRKYPSRAIPNDGYNTHGILVPRREFEKHAQVIRITE